MKANTIKIMGVVAIAATALSVASCSGAQQGQQQQAPSIAVMTLTTGNSELANTYPATIKGKTDIDIRPQVSGFITKVHVDEGQAVRRGQVLFTIDNIKPL